MKLNMLKKCLWPNECQKYNVDGSRSVGRGMNRDGEHTYLWRNNDLKLSHDFSMAESHPATDTVQP